MQENLHLEATQPVRRLITMPTATVALNGMLRSSDAIRHLAKRIDGFKDTTFRNAIHLKNLKPTKKVKNGKQMVLLFSIKSLEAYASYYNERKNKGNKGTAPTKSAGAVKTSGKQGTVPFSIPIYKSRLTILEALNKTEALREKLEAVADAFFKQVDEKLAEINV